MNEWNIQARAHHCHACGKTFSDKQSYHTLLVDQHPDLGRQDVCDACWSRDFSEGATDQKGFISYWQGVYEAPPAALPEAIQKENAESLLRKLIELNNPKFTAAGYILAVMLERKRLLKVKEQITRDGHRLFVYEHPKTGDLFTIADPALQLNQLEEVQRVVADLLELGLTPEGDIAYPPTPPPSETKEFPSEDDAHTLRDVDPENLQSTPSNSDPEEEEDEEDLVDDEDDDGEDGNDEDDDGDEDDDEEDSVTTKKGKLPATI
jgi:hypothetical protein